MIVVADTSPLNYLVLIEQAEVLRHLYGRLLIPEAVLAELQHSGAPPTVVQWTASLPDWVEVQRVRRPPEEMLETLDRGESEAIALAEQNLPDVLLLIDDESGRAHAMQRGLHITGTLGVLNDAASRGLLDLSKALDRLEKTNFRASPLLIRQLREADLARQRQ